MPTIDHARVWIDVRVDPWPILRASVGFHYVAQQFAFMNAMGICADLRRLERTRPNLNLRRLR